VFSLHALPAGAFPASTPVPAVPLAAASLVRAVHVLAASIVVGGAALLWAALGGAIGRGAASGDVRPGVGAAVAYEWGFWGAVGLLVATGVGNLGALAPVLPAAGTRWGAVFGAKLVLLVVLLVGSLGRTLVAAGPGARARGVLCRAYGVTALAGGSIVVLAVVLSHG
jgi:hypothetical protein